MMLHESQGAMIHHDIIEIIEVFKILLDMLVVGGGRDRSVRCTTRVFKNPFRIGSLSEIPWFITTP